MNKINLKQFQSHPFHLVEPSPWPILVSFSLLSLTTGAVMYMHGYPNGNLLLTLGFILTASGMGFWFKDIITEGTFSLFHTLFNHTLKIARAIPCPSSILPSSEDRGEARASA
jgi:cytochrome c oxidase subunit 3